MKIFEKAIAFILALCLCCGLSVSAFAVTYTDAHGNTIELDDSLEAYTASVLYGADAMMGEISPAIANAVASSAAYRVLIPMNLCSTYVAGVIKGSAAILEDAINHIRELMNKAREA